MLNFKKINFSSYSRKLNLSFGKKPQSNSLFVRKLAAFSNKALLRIDALIKVVLIRGPKALVLAWFFCLFVLLLFFFFFSLLSNPSLPRRFVGFFF